MIEYIKENCVLPVLEAPLYDEDSQTYDLWFDERECSWFPYPDPQLICLQFDTEQEATDTYNQALKEINDEQSTAAEKNS